MHRESNRLLHTQFLEPLTDYKIQLLKGVVQKTKDILQRFPLTPVLNASRKYWDLSYNDARIRNLEDETRRRINQNLVHNPNYSLLLNWIEEFRQLDMSSISERTPSRHVIEPIENLDTIYEIWIFMEFVEFLSEKGLLVDFQLGTDPHCKFEYNGYVVILWYEKVFAAGGPNAWIQRHKPDFTAMIDNEIIAVFDAKNYSKSSSISETKDKMLAYVTNLDANFGALIYPNHPKNWNDLNRNERIDKMMPVLSRQNPEKSEYDVRKMAKNLANLSWNQLPKEYQDIAPPINIEKYKHPGPRKKARYHLNQTLCLIRMPPTNSEQAISMKKKSLNSIFEEIVSRIPVKIESSESSPL